MVRLLHTSDFHVGRMMRGRSRADEHRAVLAEIAAVADREQVDGVVIAGDQHDVKTPSAASEDVLNEAHLLFADLGVPIVEIAGNHDSQARTGAIAPLLARAGLHVTAAPSEADAGGIIRLNIAGADVTFGMLPWVTKAEAVTAADIHNDRIAEAYATHVEGLAGRLYDAADGDVNVLVAHLTAAGATAGHGELEVATLSDYWIDPTRMGGWDWQMLGHIHKPQHVGPAESPVGRYCGAPLLLDFGEDAYRPRVDIVTFDGGRPTVEPVELTTPKKLLTLRGDAAAIIDGHHDAAVADIDYLRVKLDAAPVAGQTDAILDHFDGRCVDVVSPPRRRKARSLPATRTGRSPRELFASYLADVGEPDTAAVLDAVDALTDLDLTSSPTAGQQAA